MPTSLTHGADVAALRAWSAAAADGARVLGDTVGRLDRSVGALSWSGPDRRRFADDWTGRCAPALRGVSDALRTASVQVAGDAVEQEDASAAAATTEPTGAVALAGPAVDPAANAAREAGEAGWARGTGGALLALLGSAVGGPVGAVLSAVTGPRLVDALVGVADERAERTTVTDITDEIAPADALPTSPADLLHDMADLYDHDGAVRVDVITRPDGSRVALLYAPGTQDWSLDPGGANPMGAYGAVGAASGKDTPLRRLLLAAMAEVPAGVPIHLATHSQSSFAALDLAADPYVRARHHIASIITTGAGGGNFEVPAGTTLVSVRNPFDPVARIGGAPDRAIAVTGTWGTVNPHSSRAYAELVAGTDSPGLDAWWAGVRIDPGSTMRTRVLRGAVAPGE
ncbi:hypothetical protein EXU48_16565 [Occultella glacieicola]|uniref:Uncharacterized protein n=1 Tax=Occultella glacieicola TaxID=2518684 RepID=A0ABY2E245_9MICO|nr:hypothetical protein [Occultella glacieicola]TDE90737.1 hypothetical protein EXU48_16565 [Occultella glacieicola]